MSEAGGCLVVFARAPVAGLVKTRLFAGGHGAGPAAAQTALPPALFPEQAAHLYTAFVADVLAKGAAAGFVRRRLYADGPLEHPALVAPSRLHGFALRAQAGGDLGTRLQAAVAAELAAGDGPVVVIGSDSPTLPTAYLVQARRLLTAPAEPAEVVLGPATDGGYYLIGMRSPRPELFAAGIPWSTAGVLPETLLRLEALGHAGVRSALLPFFYDCDTPEDLRLLCAHLRHAQAQAQSIDDNDCAAPQTLQALRDLSLLS